MSFIDPDWGWDSSDEIAEAFYLDRMDIYRKLRKNPSPPFDFFGFELMYSGVPLDVHQTPNFSELISDVAMAKQVNIETANKHTAGPNTDIRDLDAVFITTRAGLQYWQAVIGAEKRGSLMPHVFFYGVPLTPPKIYVPPSAPFTISIPRQIPSRIPSQIPGRFGR